MVEGGDLGPVGGVVAHSVVGGASAVLGGGKFANGAYTAAFGYLFNHCSNPNSCERNGVRVDYRKGVRVDLSFQSCYAPSSATGVAGGQWRGSGGTTWWVCRSM